MIFTGSHLLKSAAVSGLFILSIAMAITFWRIVRGPMNADRIIALDLLSILVVALIALYAIYTREDRFLDVAIAYALVAFLGTVAFSRFLERSKRSDLKKGGGECPEKQYD